MKISKELIIQFLRFGIVGLSNTIIHTVIFNLCMNLGLNYLLSQTLGFLISSINGFVLNYKMVFKSENRNRMMIVKYYSVYTFSYVLTLLLSYLYVDIMHLNLVISINDFNLNTLPLFTLVITVPVNFILSKYWVYK